MLKLSDLALRPDIQLGPMLVSPSRRLVEGPGGHVHVEPLIMQVFLLLLDAGGKVVTRNELFDQCWGGVIVGDDSLNRAIAKARRTGAQVAPGLFEIETIPRTGYRLTGEILGLLEAGRATGAGKRGPGVSRRLIVGGGAAAVAASGGAFWLWNQPRSDPQFDALMARGEESLRRLDFGEQPESAFRQAVLIRPDSAKAWGSLGLVKSFQAEDARPEELDRTVRLAEDATRKALAIDPNEPNALLAMLEIRGSTLDWWTRDQRLRQIIAIAPRNIVAMTELVGLVQAAGLNRESWDWNERAISIEPFSPVLLGRRALKLWIAGRVLAADKVIDQLRGLYPADPWILWIRLLILALSDRPRAALALFDDNPAQGGSPTEARMWRSCLLALDQRSPATIARARQACLDAARVAGQSAAHGVMFLSALGEVDAAFDVANGFLLWRGSVTGRGKNDTRKDSQWRVWTQWLFTPPVAALRADPRFIPLCDGIGLTDYWNRRGVRPDYQIIKS